MAKQYITKDQFIEIFSQKIYDDIFVGTRSAAAALARFNQKAQVATAQVDGILAGHYNVKEWSTLPTELMQYCADFTRYLGKDTGISTELEIKTYQQARADLKSIAGNQRFVTDSDGIVDEQEPVIIFTASTDVRTRDFVDDLDKM